MKVYVLSDDDENAESDIDSDLFADPVPTKKVDEKIISTVAVPTVNIKFISTETGQPINLNENAKQNLLETAEYFNVSKEKIFKSYHILREYYTMH